MEEMQQPEAAMKAYRDALIRDKGFSDAHYNLALLHEAHGNKSDAIRHLRAAQKLRSPSRESPRKPPTAPRSGPSA